MKFLQNEGNFAIYELTEAECRKHGREFPCLVCWDAEEEEDIGNMNRTQNEVETMAEMLSWCKKYSY